MHDFINVLRSVSHCLLIHIRNMHAVITFFAICFAYKKYTEPFVLLGKIALVCCVTRNRDYNNICLNVRARELRGETFVVDICHNEADENEIYRSVHVGAHCRVGGKTFGESPDHA